jgi:N-acetylglucosamine kinase-like BadF-type ATPase
VARVLGVDIGGTRSRARLSVDGQTVAEATASSANPATVGLSQAERVLDELLSGLPLLHGSALDAACIGAAGVVGGSPEARSHFAEQLAPLVSSNRVAVLPDVALVLPAAGLQRGVALVCGTGSAALACDGAVCARAGGWGYLLGDEASGYWLVREALRTLLGRADRDQPLGPLGQSLLDAAGATSVQELRNLFYQDPRPGRWAALAPVVLSSKDQAAGAFLEEAARWLDQLVGVALERLGHPLGLPVVLAGGLTSNARFCDVVMSHLARSRPGSAISVLAEPPAAGAVRLAAWAAERRGCPVAV